MTTTLQTAHTSSVDTSSVDIDYENFTGDPDLLCAINNLTTESLACSSFENRTNDSNPYDELFSLTVRYRALIDGCWAE